jgi:hypothetical protein
MYFRLISGGFFICATTEIRRNISDNNMAFAANARAVTIGGANVNLLQGQDINLQR